MAKDYGELLAAAKNGNKLTPYEKLQMSTYKDARTASTANTNDGGYIDSALRAAKSTGLGMLGGLSYLVGAEDTAKQLQQAAQENARTQMQQVMQAMGFRHITIHIASLQHP